MNENAQLSILLNTLWKIDRVKWCELVEEGLDKKPVDEQIESAWQAICESRNY
jgi:hypothetical protein